MLKPVRLMTAAATFRIRLAVGRAFFGALGVTLFLGTTAAAPPAQARSITYNINIPPQNLNDALQALALVSRHKLLYSSELVDGLSSPALKGEFTTGEAVERLLSGTGLRYEITTDGLVLIRPASAPPGTAPSSQSTDRAAAEPDQRDETHDASIWDRFRVAQAEPSQVAANSADASGDTATSVQSSPTVEEIVVTAQKRIERLQDVPVPVTAITGDSLVSTNQARLQDYYTRIPGLNLIPAGHRNAPMLSIRGITTGAGFLQPTVGVTVDDVPYGASAGFFGGFQVPDLDPADLARIEVLRGPQGTLYGASSIGGLFKLVTVDPSTDRLSGRVQAGLSSVRNGDEMGYTVRGSVNVPLGDAFAIRASGFHRLDPGYIDDPVLGLSGVNRADTSGGRLAALWRISDDFSLKLGALMQRTDGDGSSFVEIVPGLGDLQQTNLPNTGAYSSRFEAYSAALSGRLGGMDLAALTGYNVHSNDASADRSGALGAFTFNRFGVTGNPLLNDDETKKLTQEIRLSAPIGTRFEWLAGVFYTREDLTNVQRVQAANQTTGAVVAEALLSDSQGTYSECAGFADLTFHVTERFDMQIGGRESHIRQTTGPNVQQGPFVNPSPQVSGKARTTENPFTYLVTPRFRVSPDLMLYARFASGYRPGGGGSTGPGSNCVVFGFPCEYNADKTLNYELGIKGTALDRAMSFDASLYYIEWQDIQLLLRTSGGFSYTTNAGEAKSQGIELSMESRPLTGLTLAAWTTFSDAELTQDFPLTSSAFGASGDRLPYSARFSGNGSVDQEFPLTGIATGYVGASASYIGNRKGVFTARAAPQRQEFPSYWKLDLRAGVKWDAWTADLYVNNAADKRAALSGGLGNSNPVGFNYIQPRTVGLTLAKSF